MLFVKFIEKALECKTYLSSNFASWNQHSGVTHALAIAEICLYVTSRSMMLPFVLK